MSKNDTHLNYEEEYFFHEHKESRKARKELSSKDRSKYKKTDQDKLKNVQRSDEASKAALHRGRVIEITPEAAVISTGDKEYACSLKGVFKKEKTNQKNLIAVGDFVLFELSNSVQGVIVEIEPRYSILSRADNLRRNKEQLLAVNIDQLFIITSIIMPILKPSLIDRYIIAAKQGNITPIIVINKIDLLKNPPSDLDPVHFEEELNLYHNFVQNYKALDIPIIEASCHTGEGLDTIQSMMRGKTSVFSGQSGVGKTTLINRLLGTELRTADVVVKTYKGAHTTTSAKLLPLKDSGFCIDTPGIRSFGLWKLEPADIQHYFSEFQSFASKCKYPNCQHIHEPDCAVKNAVEDGLISLMRYDSYHTLCTVPDDIPR